MTKLMNLLDILRIVTVCGAIFWGYQVGFQDGYDPIAQLHITIPLVVLAVAGISGLEGLLFPKMAAESKGFTADSNYQRQSAIALLSYAFAAVFVYFCNWGIKAELTVLFTFIFFFFFSGINHAVDAVKRRNFKWQNINRMFITLLLIAALIYPVVKIFTGLLLNGNQHDP